MSDLTSLLLYSLYAPTWTARKLDKRVTEQAKEANGVASDVDAGNFNKFMLPDCAELAAIQKYIGGARQWFYGMTAPWGEARGLRAGLAEKHLDVMHAFGDIRDGLKPLRDSLVKIYPVKVQEMEFKLHDMFNAEDYPSVDDIERRFDLRLSVQPLPNANDIRVMKEIPAHLKQEIEDSLKEEFAKAKDTALKNAVEELLTPIANLARQLKRVQEFNEAPVDGKKRPPIFDSLVDNVVKMAETARRYNLTRDPAIEALADEAEKLVANVTAKDLKESDGARVDIQKKAEALAARVAKFLPDGL
jgi:hypothetical protein